jgi:hypothetical protein
MWQPALPVLLRTAHNINGLRWTLEKGIIFGQWPDSGIWTVPPQGGIPEALIRAVFPCGDFRLIPSSLGRASPAVPLKVWQAIENEISGDIAFEHVRWFTHYHAPRAAARA